MGLPGSEDSEDAKLVPGTKVALHRVITLTSIEVKKWEVKDTKLIICWNRKCDAYELQTW